MLEMNDGELRRDPLLGAAARWAGGEVPEDEVDWHAMRSTIRSRAELPLARRRALQLASPGWVRTALPIATAAGIAALLWAGISGLESRGSSVAVAGLAESASIREVLLSDVSDQEFGRYVADLNDPNDLLLIAANRR